MTACQFDSVFAPLYHICPWNHCQKALAESSAGVFTMKSIIIQGVEIISQSIITYNTGMLWFMYGVGVFDTKGHS